MSATIKYLEELQQKNKDGDKVDVLKKLAKQFDKDEFSSSLNRVKNADLTKIYNPNNLKKIRHLDLIDKLKIDKKQSLIIGSSVLVMCGIVDKNDDIDIVTTRPMFNKAAKDINTVKNYKREYNKVFYKTPNDELEMACNFQILNTTTEKLIDRSVNIKGYNFMSLRDTYRMYRILNRPKDVHKLRRLKRIFSKGYM